MAKKSLIDQCKKLHEKHDRAIKDGRKPKFPTRVYNRCRNCGRPRGYMRRFGMCRICVRQFASDNQIMGLRKSSW